MFSMHRCQRCPRKMIAYTPRRPETRIEAGSQVRVAFTRYIVHVSWQSLDASSLLSAKSQNRSQPHASRRSPKILTCVSFPTSSVASSQCFSAHSVAASHDRRRRCIAYHCDSNLVLRSFHRLLPSKQRPEYSGCCSSSTIHS